MRGARGLATKLGGIGKIICGAAISHNGPTLGAVTREILYVRGYLGGGLNLDLRIYDMVLDFLQER